MTKSARAFRPWPASALRHTVRTLGALCLSVLGYGALTTGAFGPDGGDVPKDLPVRQVAALSFSGTDLVITGSVGKIFETSAFVGPNRVEKRSRERISVDTDMGAFTRAFEQDRIQLAALRMAPPERDELVSPRLATIKAAPGGSTAVPGPVAIASLGPSPEGPALSAIESVAPQAAAPLPLIPSAQLAYARANTPATPEYQSSTEMFASDKQLWCLTTAIYFESRGESYRGQVAVAQVVVNRTKHHLYPKTICGVVFQNQYRRNGCQFSFACDGIPDSVNDSTAWAQAQEIAQKVVAGELYLPEIGNATHYHATYVSPQWAPHMVKLAQIGHHIFYRFKGGWTFG